MSGPEIARLEEGILSPFILNEKRVILEQTIKIQK